MTGNVLLTRLRSSRWRRLAIALLAVPAILVGLLAMHVLATGGMGSSGAAHPAGGHGSAVALVHEAHDASANPSMPAPAEDCGGLCGPSHDMLGMICVLALLVTMVLLTFQLILIRWEQLRSVGAAILAMAASLASPAPPSLHVLSISRT